LITVRPHKAATLSGVAALFLVRPDTLVKGVNRRTDPLFTNIVPRLAPLTCIRPDVFFKAYKSRARVQMSPSGLPAGSLAEIKRLSASEDVEQVCDQVVFFLP
jgi:hypothetical protein